MWCCHDWPICEAVLAEPTSFHTAAPLSIIVPPVFFFASSPPAPAAEHPGRNTSPGRCAGGILANAWSTSTGSSRFSRCLQGWPQPGNQLYSSSYSSGHYMINYHCILSLMNKTPRSEEAFWRTGETAQNWTHSNETTPLKKSRIPKIQKSWIFTYFNSSNLFVIYVAKMNIMLSWDQE